MGRKSDSLLVEQVVQLFFMTSLFVGIFMYINPAYFKHVALPGKPVVSSPHHPMTTSSPAVDGLINELSGIVSSTNPYVTVIPIDNTPQQFVFSSTNEVYLQSKAMEYCVESANTFRFNIASVKSECADNIFKFVTRQIAEKNVKPLVDVVAAATAAAAAKAAAEKTATAPAGERPNYVRVEGEESVYQIFVPIENTSGYTLTVDVTNNNAVDIAQLFCSQKGKELQITSNDELLGCVRAIEKYLLEVFGAIDKERASSV